MHFIIFILGVIILFILTPIVYVIRRSFGDLKDDINKWSMWTNEDTITLIISLIVGSLLIIGSYYYSKKSTSIYVPHEFILSSSLVSNPMISTEDILSGPNLSGTFPPEIGTFGLINSGTGPTFTDTDLATLAKL